MNSESANRFIAALVKSLQTLCHGYVDFDDGIEIIGHLYLNIDSGSTFDYVLKEKVCKNAENSAVFLSKSFHAEGKPDNLLIPTNDESVHKDGVSPSGTRIQSTISSLTNVLSGNTGNQLSQSPLALNVSKRKRDHSSNFDQLNQNLPYNYTEALQSASSSTMPYSYPNPAKQLHHASNRGAAQAQGEFFGGDSNPSSGMAGEEEDDLHLDVTFVKEEYRERQSAAQLAARANQDQSSNQNVLPETMGYHGGHNQQFTSAGNTAADMSNNLNQSFQDSSQVDTGQAQLHIPPPPNPRTPVQGGFNSRQSFGLGTSNSPDVAASPRLHSEIHTIRQNKWAVARAREWLSSHGMSTNFEQFTDAELNDMMLNFYSSAQKKDGAPFSGTALLAFRTALTRHMNQQGRNISMANAVAFKPSNSVLSRIISCSVKVNRVISTSDFILLYNSGTLSMSNPESLLYKVWLELQLHLRNKVPWGRVSPNHFKFSINAANKVVVTWSTAGFGDNDHVTIQATGGNHCPVDSLKMYLMKRNPLCPAFLQVPGSVDMIAKGLWYNQEEFRDAKEKLIMKKISAAAKLSRNYTISCIFHSFEEYHHAMNTLTLSNG